MRIFKKRFALSIFLARESALSSTATAEVLCPPVGSSWQEIPPSALTITKSDEGVLCRIVLVNGDDTIPVARSYDAGNWHQYSGQFASMTVSCDQSNCTFDLETPPQGAKYVIGATSGYALSNEETVARFFESATFGMPMSGISSLATSFASLGNSAFATWIQAQQNESLTPMSSLREFYRKRLNGLFEGSSHMGEVTHPCEKSATYRRYAFTLKDYLKQVTISSISGTFNTKIEINGKLVTIVKGNVTANGETLQGSYQICSIPPHFIEGPLKLRLASGSCATTRFGGFQGNPPIDLTDITGVDVVDLDSTQAEPIDQNLYQGQTQMIALIKAMTDSVCSKFSGPQHVPILHATYNGTWFIHTPRFKISNNTVSAPIVDGGGSIVAKTSGGEDKYKAKCANVARTFLNENHCFLSHHDACAVENSFRSKLVCGSPNEVSNDLKLGGTQFNGAFDALTSWGQTDSRDFTTFRGRVWTSVVLSAHDQLRQRMSWALSQIFVVNADVTGSREFTEKSVAYYDIFVRNAFGNYRDVLKEVSYSPVMAEFLSFSDSKSTAYYTDVDRHPDENFAREVMQLFTTGIVMLNDDGTPVNGSDVTYTNDDIMEYSRVWTGFSAQTRRGNIEVGPFSQNGIDPMRIRADWRDVLPKMGLQGKYIGEGYPLCADLPKRHFLRAGAVYRLLGYTAFPELQEQQERADWSLHVERFYADPSGPLYSNLCNAQNGTSCNYKATVTLAHNLNCTNSECDVDAIRTVEVESGIFYEYVRPACVNLAFYDNATKIKMRQSAGKTYMCADPRAEEASTLCCQSTKGYRKEEYVAERVRRSTAQSRCSAPMQICSNTNSIANCSSSHVPCTGDPYYWTNESCQLKVKIRADRKIAIVHSVPSEASKATRHVNVNTKTFFRVHWNQEEAVDFLFGNCTASISACRPTVDGSCLCDVSVSEYQAFDITAHPTREDILALPFGAFQPFGQKIAVAGLSNVWVYGSGNYTKETVFEVVDAAGNTQFRKNMRSTVSLTEVMTPRLEFPTPVHMMSLAEENERDAMYETDAALDHYFYHQNTAPFLAYRFAQRFGVSNPTPQYVKAIARAFKDGNYTSAGITFGTGQYGDLAATVAAVLLHSDARNVLLDADTVHGAFREPLLKIIQVMRSLEFLPAAGAPMPRFGGLKDTIRQMAFDAPDVFSFFHPNFQPQGIISRSFMVSPEAAVMNAPEIIQTVNGFQSLAKYGLLDCYGGFGNSRLSRDGTLSPLCTRTVIGNYSGSGSTGYLSSKPDDALSAAAVIDRLSLLMTSGRLNSQSRATIRQAYEDEKNASNHARATIRAQQLILTTPEFHTTGRVTPNSSNRTRPSTRAPSSKPYKAVVFLMLKGGCDSFNMITPHTCIGSDLVNQYLQERGELALTASERSKYLVNVSGQPCRTYAVHPQLETVTQLYKEGDLSFFFNTGALNAPSSKTNFTYVTETQLFAHDAMQREAQRLDPFNAKVQTGVLGRLADVLSARGYQPSSMSIDVASVAVTGYTGTSISPTVVNSGGVVAFHPRPRGETDILLQAQSMNAGNDLRSSNVFGETWSERFTRALHETAVLSSFLQNKTVPSPPVDNNLAESFEMITKLMMTRNERASDRDVFYVEFGSFDHHDFMKDELAEKFAELDSGLKYFVQNLKTQSLWESVTLVTVSDFGRTISPNSNLGSDHGWGGNYFVTGGRVKGGKGFCKYPDDITSTSPWNVGRGRMLPSCGWESMWNPIVDWMLDGQLSDSERDQIVVNAVNSGTHLYKMADLFD